MEQLEQNIMNQVRRVHTLRRLMRPVVLKLCGFMVLTTALFSVVSVPSVLANTPSDLSSALVYLALSLMGTTAMVQTLCLSACTFAGMVVRDAVLLVVGAPRTT